MARLLGAAGVVGTVRRSRLAAARAAAGAYDEVVAGEDLVGALGDQRFDVVVDPVGGQTRTDSLDVLAPLGRMLLVGNASGDWEHTVPTNTLWGRGLAMLGFNVGAYLPAHPESAQPAAEQALRAVSEGLVDIRFETLPLAEAAEAHRRIESHSVDGRLLLAP